MGLRLFGVEISFSFWFFATLAVFALLDREVLALYFLLPVAVHELGHLLVMAVCGVKIKAVRFTPCSLSIQRKGGRLFSLGRELCVQLAGIAANLILALGLYLFAFQSMRVMFLISSNLAVAAFNLLPIGNLDGGAVVKGVSAHFFLPDFARRVSRAVSFVVLIPLFAAAIFLLLIKTTNFTLLAMCLYLVAVVIWRD